jgi:uncharacterized protein YcaQ
MIGMQKVTWARAAAWRIRRHHLDRRAPAGSLLAVASRLCGLHAQVLSSSELMAWARVEGLERKAVQQALWEDRSLVKTWAMRGTLHLLPASELPLWHAALGTSRRYRRPIPWKKYFGISLEDLDQLTVAIGEALHGRVLTREELVREVGRITGSTVFNRTMAENSWGTILKPAAFSGRLCFAPSVGQRVQFTGPESWLAGTEHAAAGPVESEAAIAAVTRRYLAAYGPATTHDLARWWGGAMSVMRKWISALDDEVVAVDLAGAKAWMLVKDARELRELKPARSVRLLPGFDQYVIGASYHAAHLLPGNLRNRVYRPQGWISPVLLVNGRMEGTWRHEIKGSRVRVAIEPFVKVQPWVKRAAGVEAERLADFLGGAAQVVWKE